MGDQPWWRETYQSLLLVPDAFLVAAGLLFGAAVIALALMPRGRSGLKPA